MPNSYQIDVIFYPKFKNKDKTMSFTDILTRYNH